jgi:hypothetical protein
MFGNEHLRLVGSDLGWPFTFVDATILQSRHSVGSFQPGNPVKAILQLGILAMVDESGSDTHDLLVSSGLVAISCHLQYLAGGNCCLLYNQLM